MPLDVLRSQVGYRWAAPGQDSPRDYFVQRRLRGLRQLARSKANHLNDVVQTDDFDRQALGTDPWTSIVTGSSTVTLRSQNGGILRLLASGAANDSASVDMISEDFDAALNPGFLARFRILSSVASVRVTFGISDSILPGGQLLVQYDSSLSANWRFVVGRIPASGGATVNSGIAAGADEWRILYARVNNVFLLSQFMFSDANSLSVVPRIGVAKVPNTSMRHSISVVTLDGSDKVLEVDLYRWYMTRPSGATTEYTEPPT